MNSQAIAGGVSGEVESYSRSITPVRRSLQTSCVTLNTHTHTLLIVISQHVPDQEGDDIDESHTFPAGTHRRSLLSVLAWYTVPPKLRAHPQDLQPRNRCDQSMRPSIEPRIPGDG